MSGWNGCTWFDTNQQYSNFSPLSNRQQRGQNKRAVPDCDSTLIQVRISSTIARIRRRDDSGAMEPEATEFDNDKDQAKIENKESISSDICTNNGWYWLRIRSDAALAGAL